ncbi:MAG: UPF0149 family protein [Desulfobacterales bacterium]|nr:UPF0149 family protein [Desulfobacterales bacterium]
MDIPKHDPEALKALFAAEPLVQLSFGLHYAYGFVLNMISAPDMIQPSEWLPMLFKSREPPEFKTKKQTEAILGALVSIWSFWAEQTEDRETLDLPPACTMDAEGNGSAELLDFCRGYLEGCDWLSDLWDEALTTLGPDAPEEKILSTTMLLCLRILKGEDFPGDASEEMKQLKSISPTEAMAALPDALTDVAALGRALHMESLRRSGPAKADAKPGRNDPCPCGSGKKYKKCCR